jgi:hypothetical protein
MPDEVYARDMIPARNNKHKPLVNGMSVSDGEQYNRKQQ